MKNRKRCFEKLDGNYFFRDSIILRQNLSGRLLSSIFNEPQKHKKKMKEKRLKKTRPLKTVKLLYSYSSFTDSSLEEFNIRIENRIGIVEKLSLVIYDHFL